MFSVEACWYWYWYWYRYLNPSGLCRHQRWKTPMHHKWWLHTERYRTRYRELCFPSYPDWTEYGRKVDTDATSWIANDNGTDCESSINSSFQIVKTWTIMSTGLSHSRELLPFHFNRSYFHSSWRQRRYTDWPKYILGRVERDVDHPSTRNDKFVSATWWTR